MANNKIFTMPLVAGNYVIDDSTGASFISVSNDTGSGGNISVTGNENAIINGTSVASSAIVILPTEKQEFSSTTPMGLTIVVATGATGKLILIV